MASALIAISANDFVDMPSEDHWSYNALNNAVNNGLLKGDGNRLNPDGNVTRAELAAILNRAFGATETADISAFKDVSEKSWYYADMAKALNMGTFSGSSDNTLLPEDNATRQETFCVIARALKLSSDKTEVLNKFSDSDKIADWAKESLAALVNADFIHGSDNELNPEGKITRAELAQLMDNIFKAYITKQGTYTVTAGGSVMINTPDVFLNDTVADGDLIIGEGVGNGNVTLENTTINGRLLIRGGGENSILIKNSNIAGDIVLCKTGSGAVRIKTEGGKNLNSVYIYGSKGGVIIEGRYNNLFIETDAPVTVTNAAFNAIDIFAKNAKLSIDGKTTVESLTIDELAGNTTVYLSENSIIKQRKIDNDSSEIIEAKGTTRSGSSGGSAKISGSDLISETPISADNVSRFEIKFSADMNAASATDISNYQILDCGTTEIQIKRITLTDSKTALITLDGRLTNNSTAKVTVKKGLKTLGNKTLARDFTFDMSVSDITTPNVSDITFEVIGAKSLKLTFTEPVCDGTDNSLLDAENFAVKQLRPHFDSEASTYSNVEYFSYTVSTAELSEDSITLTFNENILEGNLSVTVNANGTEVGTPIQDCAGNKISMGSKLFAYVNDGEIATAVTIKSATQTKVTLGFSDPITARNLTLYYADSSVSDYASFPVSLGHDEFVNELTFDFDTVIPVGETDFFLVNGETIGEKAVNIYGELVPDTSLDAEVVADTDAPSVTGIRLIDNKNIVISFNEVVSDTFAEDCDNYDFYENENLIKYTFTPTLNDDKKSVTISTARSLIDNTRYTFKVKNAEDLCGNVEADEQECSVASKESENPYIVDCFTINSEGKVIIIFSEPMNEYQVVNKANYMIKISQGAVQNNLGDSDNIIRISDRAIAIDMYATEERYVNVNTGSEYVEYFGHPTIKMESLIDIFGNPLNGSTDSVDIDSLEEGTFEITSAELIDKNKIKFCFNSELQGAFNSSDIIFSNSAINIESYSTYLNEAHNTEMIAVLNTSLTTDGYYEGSKISLRTNSAVSSKSIYGIYLHANTALTFDDMTPPEVLMFDHDNDTSTEPVEKVKLSGDVLEGFINGNVDFGTTGEVTIFYSEDISSSRLSASTYSVEGYVVTGISVVNGNEVIVFIRADSDNTSERFTVTQEWDVSDLYDNCLPGGRTMVVS